MNCFFLCTWRLKELGSQSYGWSLQLSGVVWSRRPLPSSREGTRLRPCGQHKLNLYNPPPRGPEAAVMLDLRLRVRRGIYTGACRPRCMAEGPQCTRRITAPNVSCRIITMGCSHFSPARNAKAT